MYRQPGTESVPRQNARSHQPIASTDTQRGWVRAARRARLEGQSLPTLQCWLKLFLIDVLVSSIPLVCISLTHGCAIIWSSQNSWNWNLSDSSALSIVINCPLGFLVLTFFPFALKPLDTSSSTSKKAVSPRSLRAKVSIMHGRPILLLVFAPCC